MPTPPKGFGWYRWIILIYVTSNRRHLLPEYESDNRGAMFVNNEIHHGESVEEKISLSGWVGHKLLERGVAP
jgi:predicted AAA+ superfamily ATPase